MLKVGSIFRIKMYPENGITPKENDIYRYKYIIVGYDGEKFYGTVVTNTKDHHLVPIEFQYPLNLDGHKCFANCQVLYPVSSSRLTEQFYKGKISNEDIELILECVKTSPVIHNNELRKFGLLF